MKTKTKSVRGNGRVLNIPKGTQILRHDLVNAIYAINGHCENYFDSKEKELISDDEKLKKAENVLHRLKGQTKGLVLIAKKLEKTSQLKASKRDQYSNLYNCWKAAMAHARSEKINANGEYICHIPKDFPQIACFDEDLIEALGYVTQNALDAIQNIDQGRVIIRSRIEFSNERSWAIIEIVDNGNGIEPTNLPMVFDPFFTTKIGQGSGLGLFLAKRLVDGNLGKISVSSLCGYGTVSRIKLPTRCK